MGQGGYAAALGAMPLVPIRPTPPVCVCVCNVSLAPPSAARVGGQVLSAYNLASVCRTASISQTPPARVWRAQVRGRPRGAWCGVVHVSGQGG
jgi:hypothetical protein